MFSSDTTQVADGGYQISRSLRFNSADSAYLNRTPASAGNRRTWTWSGWVKRSALGADQALFGRCNVAGSVHTGFIFKSNDAIQFFSDNNGPYGLMDINTAQVFRDVSAWYHLVFVLDTTQATASNRAKIYVNGVQVTSFSSAAYPNQNDEYQINTTNPHGLGRYLEFSSNWYLSGYMTEVNFIDGQALTPSSFGETNAQTGVWQPKAYSGSYGTNGFYLNFSDNSNTTAATLGKDYSGNGNNWTPNNFSVTAGAGNDSLVDSPTAYGFDTGVGGTVRGNYATLLPTYGSTGTFSNGNLDLTTSSANTAAVPTGFFPNTSKWYWEVLITAIGNSNNASLRVGVCNPNGVASGLGEGTNGWSFLGDGRVFYNSSASSYGVSVTTGDTMMVALDIDAGKIWYGKNGTWMASGDPVTGANASQTFTANQFMSPALASGTGTPAYTCNFGQRPFAYTAPSGYKALCTQNLPTPTIGATSTTLANLYFNPVLYTGDRTDRTITVGFQPDWVWVKSRNAVDDHYLMNAVVGTGKYLDSNSTASEVTNANSLTAYTSTGFSVGNTGTTNETGRTYVAWNWKANGSGSTNTAGSITSTVSANTTSGFSVVTYTGTGANATVGHGLGVAPSMVICKTRTGSSVGAWQTYHSALGATKTVFLNLTDAAYTNSLYWNNTAPTSSVFSLGGNTDGNGSGYTMVAYCFAEISGYSKFGSYTGNGSTDGPMVWTGFRPAYIMYKRTDAISDWGIVDATRNPSNVVGEYLAADLSNAGATYSMLDILSNGFKPRWNDTSNNASGGTYIFMAFASAPFKYALAR